MHNTLLNSLAGGRYAGYDYPLVIYLSQVMHMIRSVETFLILGGTESDEPPPWLAPSEKIFPEPPDCRKRLFQSICKEKKNQSAKNI